MSFDGQEPGGARAAQRPVPRTGRDRTFVVEISALKHAPGSRIAIERSGLLAELSISGSCVPDGEPVEFSGVLEAVYEGILVTGTVTSPWTGTCRRCLEPARGVSEVTVRELCVEGGDPETTYPLSPTMLDLRPIIHDACILELPLAPLCREDCLGLCPECGTNRNLEPCSCRPRADARWAALAVLGDGGATEQQDGSPERPSMSE
jgi:uncharacterized protein